MPALAVAAVFGGGLLLPPHATPNGTTAAAPSATSNHLFAIRFSFMGSLVRLSLGLRPQWLNDPARKTLRRAA
jgi:hypothetical protein